MFSDEALLERITEMIVLLERIEEQLEKIEAHTRRQVSPSA